MKGIVNDFKSLIAIILTTATISISAVIWINSADADTLLSAQKSAAQLYAPREDVARIEEQLKEINKKLDQILNKI